MPERLPKVLNRADVTALLNQPNIKTPTGLRNRAMLETMYRAGLRVSEVTALTTSDVQIDELRIDVRRTKRGKSRAVPIGDTLAGWLQAWATQRPTRKKCFFCTLKGGPVSTTYLRIMVSRYAVKVELDPMYVSPHVLRHTYATERLEDGFSLKELQELLGHSRISTTEIYLHVRPEELAAKVRRLDQATTEEAADLAEKLKRVGPNGLRVLKRAIEDMRVG